MRSSPNGGQLPIQTAEQMKRAFGWGQAGLVAGIVIVTLAAYNIARSTVLPGDAHFFANALVAVGVVAIGLAFGLRRDELGLDSADLRTGVRLGLPVAAAIGAVVIGAAFVPAAADFFDDDRVDVSFAEMTLRVLVVIPIGTVLVEELIFRGVLHGLLRRRLDIWRAGLLGAAVFALWHLFPVWQSYTGATRFEDETRWADVAGTFAATFMAGAGFIWLRHRARHLIAPTLAHVATNSVPFAVAWFLAR
jgi:membrane protease YdiL (CAAX protease family)